MGLRSNARLIGIVCVFPLIGFSTIITADEPDLEMAYLIIDAVANYETKRQPKWIAFANRPRGVHIPTGEYIVEIKPGRYYLSHIDFNKNHRSWSGTHYIAHRLILNFEPKKIYLIGRFELNQGKPIDLITDIELLKQACLRAPELFEKYPVRHLLSTTPDEDIFMSCQSE